MLSQKEAQAAGHRQRRDRRENRIARVGFDSFKELQDHPSPHIASQIFFGGTCAAPKLPLDPS
jgi:hypothetical protein